MSDAPNPNKTDIYHLKKGSNTLFISFSALQLGNYSTSAQQFQFYGSLSQKSHDTLFIKDAQDLWYQFGAKDVGSSIEEIAKRIKEISKNYARVVTVGTSMGGYAAMIIGALIEADDVLAIAGQSFIDTRHRIKYRDFRWPNRMDVIHGKSADKKYEDLRPFFRQYAGKTKIHMVYGELDVLDRIHALRMAEFPAFNIYEVQGTTHWTALAMKESGIFSKVLYNLETAKLLTEAIDNKFLMPIKDDD